MSDPESGPPDRLNVALAEFNALRAEILSRMTAQQNLLNLTLVATGAAGSVAFSEASRQPILLVVPVVSCIFGMLYFDHRLAVDNIGEYIRDELAPAVRRESNWSEAINWEDAIRRVMSSRGRFRRSAFQFDIPILFAFLLIPAVITAYMATQLTTTWLWLAWSVGILAEILTAAAGLQAAHNWRMKPLTRSQSD